MNASPPVGEIKELEVSDERIGYTPAEVGRAVGLSPDTIRDKILKRHIAATKLGGRYIVSAAEVRRLFGAVPALMI